MVALPTASGEPVHRVLAGLPRRLLALAVDALLQAVVLGAAALVVGLISRLVPPSGAETLQSALIAVVVLTLSSVILLWPALFETRWQGVTPGKRVAGIRVIDRLGGAPRPGQVLVRNLLRVADLAPGAGLVGLVSAFVDPLGRRVGDLVAGTLVVLDQAAEAPPPGPRSRDLDLARALLERWERLDEAERVQLAAKLADRFRERGADLHISDREVLRRALRSGSAAHR